MSNIVKTQDVQFVGDTNRIDSRIVAKAIGIQHESFFAMLNKHKVSIEEAFGLLRFEIVPDKLGRMNTPVRFVMLTEDQAIAAVNLSRNTEQAVKAKIALAKAFSEARKALAAKQRIEHLRIQEQTHRDTQVANSKRVNALKMRVGGVEGIKIYNRENCKAHSGGYTPTQVKAIGKKRGLKAKQRTSAKEVFRHIAEHIAAAMSFTDDMILRGLPQEAAFEIGRESQSIFKKMLAYGVRPAELDS